MLTFISIIPFELQVLSYSVIVKVKYSTYYEKSHLISQAWRENTKTNQILQLYSFAGRKQTLLQYFKMENVRDKNLCNGKENGSIRPPAMK